MHGDVRAEGRTVRASIAALSALAVAVALLVQPAGPAAADEVVQVAYPTAAGPAAAQVGDIFDIDVTTASAGSVEGAIRPVGGGDWQPLDVVTLTPVVQPGTAEATAIVPEGTATGAYDLRLQVTDDGAVVGEDVVAGGLVVEDYGFASGFEDRDGASWTTEAEEHEFLDELAASPRVAIDVLGSTVEGRPMHMVRIGHPRPPSIAEAAADGPVMMVCSQHGNEPAPREACLRALRRLAFTSDARTTEYLADTTVFVIPTANPDGRAANRRQNADGFDLNRDHLRLATPEGRLMGEALRDVRPDYFGDLHEFGTSSPSRPALEVIWGRHLNIDEGVRGLAREWGNDWVRPRAEANGFSTGPYVANPGTGENVTILNAAALRHAVAWLTETRTSALPGEPSDTASVQRRRVANNDLNIHESLRFHRLNADRIAAAVDAARAAKTAQGLHAEGPYFFYGNSEDPQDPPPADSYLERTPCGYLLSPEQTATVQHWIDSYDVHTVAVGRRTYVPMGQEAQPVIGLMLDDRSAGSNEVAGDPWPTRLPNVPVRCNTDGLGFRSIIRP